MVFSNRQINSVKDLKDWCDWLIEAGYGDAEVGVNQEYSLSIFNETHVKFVGGSVSIDLC